VAHTETVTAPVRAEPGSIGLDSLRDPGRIFWFVVDFGVCFAVMTAVWLVGFGFPTGLGLLFFPWFEFIVVPGVLIYACALGVVPRR
jgi:hypothetical protein